MISVRKLRKARQMDRLNLRKSCCGIAGSSMGYLPHCCFDHLLNHTVEYSHNILQDATKTVTVLHPKNQRQCYFNEEGRKRPRPFIYFGLCLYNLRLQLMVIFMNLKNNLNLTFDCRMPSCGFSGKTVTFFCL